MLIPVESFLTTLLCGWVVYFNEIVFQLTTTSTATEAAKTTTTTTTTTLAEAAEAAAAKPATHTRTVSIAYPKQLNSSDTQPL